MASSGTIYSNKASGSFTSGGTTYKFTDARWYVSWSQSKSSHGQSTVSFTVWTTKTNSSPRNLTAGGTITITAKTGTIASGNTSLTFTKTGRSFAKSGGNNYVQQALADDGAQTFSFVINHTAAGAAAFTVAFNMNCAGYTAAGGGDGTLDTNCPDYTLSLTAGTGISSVSGADVYQGGSSVTATASVMPGYTFSKWAQGSTSKSTSASYSFTMPNSNLSLTASATANTYKMTFAKNGGSVSPTTKNVTFGTVATGLPTPTRNGYKFKGWSVSLDSSIQNWYCLGRNHMYTDKFSVHLEAYAADWSAVANQRLISCTEGGGWNIEPSGSNVAFIAYDSGVGYKYATSSVSWASLGKNTWHAFDIIFNGTYLKGYIDGTCVATSPAFSSKKISYNASNMIVLGAEAGPNQSTPAGAFFGGKFRNVVIYHDTTLRDNDDTKNSFIVPAESFTLTADWELITYDVSYNANGGTPTPDTQTKTHGVALTLAGAITRSAAGKKVKTTFDAQGGSYTNNSSWVITTTALSPYTFDGWEATNGTVYNAGASYTANESTVMTARWDGGVEYTGNPVTLNTPTRIGYTFEGWYTAPTDGDLITDEYRPTIDNTVYAHWTANRYNVYIYDYALDVEHLYGSVTYGKTITLPDMPSPYVWRPEYISGELNFVMPGSDYTEFRPVNAYSRYYPIGYYDENLGLEIPGLQYTHKVDCDAYILLRYNMDNAVRLEFTTPNWAGARAHMVYWQKSGESDSRLPPVITPGSVVDIVLPDHGGLFDGNALSGTYIDTERPGSLAGVWHRSNGEWKATRPVYKANGAFQSADIMLVKHDGQWLTLEDYIRLTGSSSTSTSTLDSGTLDQIILG